MRKGLLSSVATALVGASSALAQNPSYLPTDGLTPLGPVAGTPALLSADQGQLPAQPTAPALTGGSTGLVPGVDCLPASVPHHPRFYGDFSYLLTSVKEGPSPGSLAIATPVGAGPFGPGTTTVLGGRKVDYGGQSGFQGLIGMFFDCESKVGFEVGGFVLGRQDQGTALFNDGSATNTFLLARPFVNLNTVPATPVAALVGAPGAPGGIADRETTRMWGYEANGVLNWRDDCHRRTDLLAGFTYLDLRETLGVTSTTVAGPGLSTAFNDVFDTRNQFYGGQVGARTCWTFGKLGIAMTSTIALGVTHEVVDRFGSSTVSTPATGPVTAPVGFLVQSSNAGRQTVDRFAVALPSQILFGYQWTDHINTFIGYDFKYVSSVARPGDQVDRSFQTNPATGAAFRPAPGINSSEFWANSLMFGLALKY
jgi:hypothetical protein